MAKRPKRIVHVFGGLNRGGAQTMIMNIYRNINREHVQFDFIVHGNKLGDYEKEIEQLGGNIYRVPKYKVINHIQYKKSWSYLLKKIKNKVNVIHAHMDSTAKIYLNIAKKYEYTTIIHSHNTSDGRGFKSILKSILKINIKKNSDYLFACGDEAGKWMFGKREEFHVIPNSINVEKFNFNKTIRSNKRKDLGVEKNIVLGHIGRFQDQKNHLFLIDIISELKNINPRIKLVLIGDGDLKDIIKKKSREKKLEKYIKFLGVRSDIPDLLQAMDYFVLPSKYEGLPVVLIEAQASGLKSFVSNSVTKEVDLNQQINYISLNQSAEEWARIINENIEKKYERENSGEIVKNKGYEVRDTAKKLEEFYLKL